MMKVSEYYITMQYLRLNCWMYFNIKSVQLNKEGPRCYGFKFLPVALCHTTKHPVTDLGIVDLTVYVRCNTHTPQLIRRHFGVISLLGIIHPSVYQSFHNHVGQLVDRMVAYRTNVSIFIACCSVFVSIFLFYSQQVLYLIIIIWLCFFMFTIEFNFRQLFCLNMITISTMTCAQKHPRPNTCGLT